jgi:hypothetical protein
MAFSSVIAFIVNVKYILVLDPKRQAPVASDVQAPDPSAISGKLVRFPLPILTNNTVARRLTPVN